MKPSWRARLRPARRVMTALVVVYAGLALVLAGYVCWEAGSVDGAVLRVYLGDVEWTLLAIAALAAAGMAGLAVTAKEGLVCGRWFAFFLSLGLLIVTWAAAGAGGILFWVAMRPPYRYLLGDLPLMVLAVLAYSVPLVAVLRHWRRLPPRRAERHPDD